MSPHSTYESLRHLADSWGLMAMAVVFVAFAAWPFRPGAREDNDTAANMIFKDDDHGE
ncbi:MAG: cbb3-type cytochrome c oxidase subunit 3 [Sphingomonadales bacterium]|nr:cbb3-type cytochrome c oxidase subunit 3 [Sphingomonadales bacterium]